MKKTTDKTMLERGIKWYRWEDDPNFIRPTIVFAFADTGEIRSIQAPEKDALSLLHAVQAALIPQPKG